VGVVAVVCAADGSVELVYSDDGDAAGVRVGVGGGFVVARAGGMGGVAGGTGRVCATGGMGGDRGVAVVFDAMESGAARSPHRVAFGQCVCGVERCSNGALVVCRCSCLSQCRLDDRLFSVAGAESVWEDGGVVHCVGDDCVGGVDVGAGVGGGDQSVAAACAGGDVVADCSERGIFSAACGAWRSGVDGGDVVAAVFCLCVAVFGGAGRVGIAGDGGAGAMAEVAS